MPEQKALYREFCASAPADFPLFMQDWYLDAICAGGEWAAIVHQINGETLGVWPYFIKKKAFWQYIAMPLMGKWMGPYIIPSKRQPTPELRILEAMTEQLPKGLAAFQQDFNYTATNWLPLYWQGYTQTTRYSYVLSLALTEAQLWANIEKNYQRKIKKAQQLVEVRTDLDADVLYAYCEKSFVRQALDFPLDRAYFQGMVAAFEQHRAGQAFFAVDKTTGIAHSVAYLVWDQSAAYLLWSGDHPELRQSGASVLLQWTAIQYAKNTLQLPVFDFEGSMIRAIEQGRRHFGASQKPYFRVRREWSLLWKVGKFLLR